MLVRQEKLWRSSWLCLDYLYEEIETILDVSLGSITGWKLTQHPDLILLPLQFQTILLGSLACSRLKKSG